MYKDFKVEKQKKMKCFPVSISIITGGALWPVGSCVCNGVRHLPLTFSSLLAQHLLRKKFHSLAFPRSI